MGFLMMNDAPTPSARQFCLAQRRVPAGQASRWFALSSAALGVAAYLASTAPACAHDTKPAGAPHAARSATAAPASLPLQVPVPLPDPALLLPIVVQSQAASAGAAKSAPSPSPKDAKPASGEPTTVEVTPAAEAPPAGEACEGECPAKRKSEISLLPELILRNLEEVPLLAVMMLPVTEGVTITPAEGLPAVTFAVKPTKITRGSGLVAVGKF